MAQLKDTVVQGSLRITDATYTDTAQAENYIVTPNIYATDNLYLRTKWSGGTSYNTIAQLNANSILPGSTSGTRTLGDSNNRWSGVYADSYNNLAFTAADTGFTIAGGTASKTLTVNNDYTLNSACTYSVDDATANGALGTGTGLTTERSVYYGLVTVNNASQTRATGIYAPTSAGTANQILVSSGGTAAPVWKATANGAAYATSANGALTFGTLPVAQGGTGITTATYKNAIIAGNASTVTNAFQAIRTNNGAFYATAQDGAPSFGTLPIAQGGTGAISAGAARCNLEEGNYLSCTTAADEANKTVAYPGFSLKNGIVINITFTNQNTADINTPTLNVENTGAKEIRCNGTAVKRQGLAAGYLYRLLYDGTYWQVLNPRIDFIGTCTTAGNTSNKVVEIPGFVPYSGAKVSIIFQNNNSYRGIINLNINGYGNKPVYNFGLSQVTTWYTFNAGQSYEFVYNGTNYYVVNNSFRRDITLGVTQTNTVSQVHGTDYLYLGNNLTSTTDNGLTGGLRLYSASTSYITLSASKHTDSTKNPFWYFPNMDSTARYFISSNSTSAIGSATQPVYITTNGRVTACTNTLDLVYPVGSIYITVNNIDLTSAQNIVFPGTTWVRIQDAFLLAAGTTYQQVETTGGEASHTLTVNEMPSHFHYPYGGTETENDLWCYGLVKLIQGRSGALELEPPVSGSVYKRYGFASNETWNDLFLRQDTGSTGGGAAHNNMPPYYTVYVWKRVT